MQAPDKETATEAGVENTEESTAPVVDSTPSLEETLRLAEQKAEEHHDAWLRAKAESENVRRRAQEDIAKASKFAVERFAGELLAVKDNPVGEKFDPHFHQAISMVDAEQEPNTVVTVLQKGYLIADRVLRPALVIVSKPKS